MPRPHLRFSLLTFLFLTTIVAMAIVLMMQWREMGPMHAELRRLRAETGQLAIDDPQKAYAIAIPMVDDDTWRWRIYLPPGRRYALYEYSGYLPNQVLFSGRAWYDEVKAKGGGGSSSSTAQTGEFILDAHIDKDGGQWVMTTKARHQVGPQIETGGSRVSIHQPHGDWLADNRGRIVSSSVNATKQREFGPDEPILLLHRIRPVITELPGGGYTSSTPTGPADGFALWLEPEMPPANPPAGNP